MLRGHPRVPPKMKPAHLLKAPFLVKLQSMQGVALTAAKSWISLGVSTWAIRLCAFVGHEQLKFEARGGGVERSCGGRLLLWREGRLLCGVSYPNLPLWFKILSQW